MIRTVDFVMDFDPANPPKRMKTGGVRTTPVAASKALEMRGVKTEAIKDLETPPPVSVADTSTNTLPPQTLPFMRQENRPEDFTKEFPMMKFEDNNSERSLPQEVPMSPELLMVMNSLNNMGGIMSTPTQPKTGLAALSEITYGDGGTIKV